MVDDAVVLCTYGDSDICLDCSKSEAKVLYKTLAAHTSAMGDPTRVRKYDSIFGSGEARSDTKQKVVKNEESKVLSPAAEDKDEEEPGHPKVSPPPSSSTFKLSVMRAQSSAILDSVKDYYTSNRKDQLPDIGQYHLKSASEEELLADSERELKKVAVGLWQRLDILMMRLVCSWAETHRRLWSCQCMCIAFINSSHDSIQFHNIVKREGKAYRLLEGHDWDPATHQLRPSGVGILFAWGHSPGLSRGNVVIEVETSAFSGTFTLKTFKTKVINKGHFSAGFVEKIMTAEYTMMVLVVT